MGHLAGVRRYTVGNLRQVAPRLYHRLADDVPKGQSVCLVAYRALRCGGGGQADRPARQGSLAVAVVTWPGKKLLGHAHPRAHPGALRHSHPF